MRSRRQAPLIKSIAVLMLLIFFCASESRGQATQDSAAIPNSESAAAVNDATAVKAAATEPLDRPEAPAAGSDFSWFRTLGGFGLVLCLIVLGYYAARKYAPQFFIKSVSGKNLRLIESLSMGEKRSLSVVELDDRRFLLGNTTHQITLLAELPGRLSLTSDAPSSPALAFAAPRNMPISDSFKNLFDREKGPAPRASGRHIPPDIRAKMRQLRESL